MPRFYSNSFVTKLTTSADTATDLPNIRNANKYAHYSSVSGALVATTSAAANTIYVLGENMSSVTTSPSSTGNLHSAGNAVSAYVGSGSFPEGNITITASGTVFQVLVMDMLLELKQTDTRAITSYNTTRSIRDSHIQEDLYGTRTLQLGSSRGAKRNIAYTIWQSGTGVIEGTSGSITVPYNAPSGTAVRVSVTLSDGTFNSMPVSSSNTLRVTISGTAIGGGGQTENLTFTSPNQTKTTTNSFASITSATIAPNGTGDLSLSIGSSTGEGAITNARNALSRLYDIQRQYPNFIIHDLDEDHAQDYRAIFPAYWMPDSFSESIEGNQVIRYSFAVEER